MPTVLVDLKGVFWESKLPEQEYTRVLSSISEVIVARGIISHSHYTQECNVYL